ncbi:hypothetical protein ACGFJC_47465 [Nonomuraea fuscirosea]|uniref:hypothetical protein n=1 Tax=Nonomuraea fuscirosea TaxID=1291556 RepID=UPI0037112BF2
MDIEGAWRVWLVVGAVIGLAALAWAWPALTAWMDGLITPWVLSQPISGGT